MDSIKEKYPEIPVGTRAENLTGKIFNNWKVLYRTVNNKQNKTVWVCECQCEKKTIKPIASKSLKANTSKDCGCGRLKTISLKSDLKIHKRDENGNIISKKCFRCGEWLPLNEFWRNSAQKDGYCGECKTCQNTSKTGRYNIYKQNAKVRKLEFKLSKDDFEEITSKPCYYCGDFSKGYNGIDRYDSKIGYIKENCVPCCEICNKMKLNYNINDWLSHMNKILNHMQ